MTAAGTPDSPRSEPGMGNYRIREPAGDADDGLAMPPSGGIGG